MIELRHLAIFEETRFILVQTWLATLDVLQLQLVTSTKDTTECTEFHGSPKAMERVS